MVVMTSDKHIEMFQDVEPWVLELVNDGEIGPRLQAGVRQIENTGFESSRVERLRDLVRSALIATGKVPKNIVSSKAHRLRISACVWEVLQHFSAHAVTELWNKLPSWYAEDDLLRYYRWKGDKRLPNGMVIGWDVVPEPPAEKKSLFDGYVREYETLPMLEHDVQVALSQRMKEALQYADGTSLRGYEPTVRTLIREYVKQQYPEQKGLDGRPTTGTQWRLRLSVLVYKTFLGHFPTLGSAGVLDALPAWYKDDLKDYFNWLATPPKRHENTSVVVNDNGHITRVTHDDMLDSARYMQQAQAALDQFYDDQLTKENTMAHLQPAKVETKVFINDLDASALTDEAIYDMIAKLEEQVATYEKLNTKPAKLAVKIDALNKSIADLAAYVDNRTK